MQYVWTLLLSIVILTSSFCSSHIAYCRWKYPCYSNYRFFGFFLFPLLKIYQLLLILSVHLRLPTLRLISILVGLQLSLQAVFSLFGCIWEPRWPACLLLACLSFQPVPLQVVLSLFDSNFESRDNLPVSSFCLNVILICPFLSRWFPFGPHLSLQAVSSLFGCNVESRVQLLVSYLFDCDFDLPIFELLISLWAATITPSCIVSVWLQSCSLCWPACLLFVWLWFWSICYEPLISLWAAAITSTCIVFVSL